MIPRYTSVICSGSLDYEFFSWDTCKEKIINPFPWKNYRCWHNIHVGVCRKKKIYWIWEREQSISKPSPTKLYGYSHIGIHIKISYGTKPCMSTKGNVDTLLNLPEELCLQLQPFTSIDTEMNKMTKSVVLAIWQWLRWRKFLKHALYAEKKISFMPILTRKWWTKVPRGLISHFAP